MYLQEKKYLEMRPTTKPNKTQVIKTQLGNNYLILLWMPQEMTEEDMKVEVVSLPSVPDPSLSDSTPDEVDFGSLEISIEKLALVIGITFAFILLLLFSLICIFYVMGCMQNFFGYSWAVSTRRAFSPHNFYPDHQIINLNRNTLDRHESRCHSSQSHHRVLLPHGQMPYTGGGAVQTC